MGAEFAKGPVRWCLEAFSLSQFRGNDAVGIYLVERNIPQCRGWPPETKIYLVQDLPTVRIPLCGSPGSAKPRMSSQCYGDIRKMQGFHHLSCEAREKSAITFLPCFPLGTIILEHGLLVNVAVFCHNPSRVQIKAFVLIIGRGIFF